MIFIYDLLLGIYVDLQIVTQLNIYCINIKLQKLYYIKFSALLYVLIRIRFPNKMSIDISSKITCTNAYNKQNIRCLCLFSINLYSFFFFVT